MSNIHGFAKVGKNKDEDENEMFTTGGHVRYYSTLMSLLLPLYCCLHLYLSLSISISFSFSFSFS